MLALQKERLEYFRMGGEKQYLRVEANVGYVLQKNDSLGVTGLSCFLKKQCLQAFFKS